MTAPLPPTARPILMSAPMVRALIAGTKTQTRRIIKPVQPRGDGKWPAGRDPVPDCPYGIVGQYLWVREAVCLDWCERPIYKADDVSGRGARDAGFPREPRYKPSIHMPRHVSRLTLRIADVRVERLQDISKEDAIAEGLRRHQSWGGAEDWRVDGADCSDFDPRRCYAKLWESINGEGSWARNDWIWVVAFAVEKRNVDDVLRDARAA